MSNDTASTKTAEINPCAWDINVSYDDGNTDVSKPDGVSVRRTDGLPFEHYECQVKDHVRAVMAARGIDIGNQCPMFTRGGRVCILLDR